MASQTEMLQGFLAFLTHINLASFLWDSADSDQTPQNVSSDQGFYCLLTE